MAEIIIGKAMESLPPNQDDDMPAEIDFANAVRGLHHIPKEASIVVTAVEPNSLDLDDDTDG